MTLKLVLSKLLILDRELPPDDEHLKNPADITKVDPIFKGKIDTDNRRSTIYLNTEDHLTCSSSTSNIIVDDSTVSKPNLKESLEKKNCHSHVSSKYRPDKGDVKVFSIGYLFSRQRRKES